MRFVYFISIPFLILSTSCSRKSEKISQKTYETIISSDSLEYKEIMFNYGNYWQHVNDSTRNILFDNYNGKMIIFKNFQKLNKSNEADNMFTIEIDSLNPKRLIGNYGFIEVDVQFHNVIVFNIKSKLLCFAKLHKEV